MPLGQGWMLCLALMRTKAQHKRRNQKQAKRLHETWQKAKSKRPEYLQVNELKVLVGMRVCVCVCTSEGLQSQIQSSDLVACVHQDGVVSPAVNAGVS